MWTGFRYGQYPVKEFHLKSFMDKVHTHLTTSGRTLHPCK